jgi:hypothetical protein
MRFSACFISSYKYILYFRPYTYIEYFCYPCHMLLVELWEHSCKSSSLIIVRNNQKRWLYRQTEYIVINYSVLYLNNILVTGNCRCISRGWRSSTKYVLTVRILSGDCRLNTTTSSNPELYVEVFRISDMFFILFPLS